MPPQSIGKPEETSAGGGTAPQAAPDVIDDVLQQLAGAGSRLDLTVAGARLRLTNLDRVYWPATD